VRINFGNLQFQIEKNYSGNHKESNAGMVSAEQKRTNTNCSLKRNQMKLLLLVFNILLRIKQTYCTGD
jgi:hypothetical protein